MSLKRPLLAIVIVAAVLLGSVLILTPKDVKGAPTSTITIEPWQDTYVDEILSTTNFGSSADLWVSAEEFDRQQRALLQFLLTGIPAGATIHSAELQLYLAEATGTSNVELTVERNGSGWAEGAVKWTTRPATHCCWGASIVGTTTGVYHTWDVTLLVQNWYDGTLPNNGLTLRGPGGAFWRQFHSSRGTFKPKLVVEYTLPGTPPPVPPTGAINGRVWHDDNRDGFQNAGEPGLEGVRVDQAFGGVIQNTTTTDSNGDYGFSGLGAGVHSVSVDDWTLPGGYQLATGTDPRFVTLVADDSIVNAVGFGYDLPDTDLVATDLEVTQAIQDLNNSVRMVRDKRTFVRFHVRSSSGVQRTTASLVARKGGSQVFLLPLNTDTVVDVQPMPSRVITDHAFLFELPSEYTQGTVALTATLNPLLPPIRPVHSPLEQTYDNNRATASVTYESVPDLNLVMYRVGYQMEGTGANHIASMFHVNMAHDWLRRAYPVANVWMTVRNLMWGTVGVNNERNLTGIGCGDVHTRVDGLTSANRPLLLGGDFYRSYGLVDNGGGFMRGCSMVGSRSASGPTGDPGSGGWDTDGSYGDWYTGHELGHSLHQHHVRGGPRGGSCGTEGGLTVHDRYNPYGLFQGTISPVLTGDDAMVGYDFGRDETYTPVAHDVMTYCDYQWPSDYTYQEIMDLMQSEATAAAAAAPLAATDQLLVVGALDPDTTGQELDPLFVFPTVDDAPPPTTGDYAIVLRDGAGTELARHAFTPGESQPGPPAPGASGEHEVSLAFAQFVPFASGADKVEIEGPGGTILAQVSAGTAEPTVSITAPAGGSVLAGETVTVTWTANDADGDDLSFLVQYSPDDGATWENVTFPTTVNSIGISRLNLVAGTKSRFRVLASDGVHTGSDTSNLVTVPNDAPQIELWSPQDGATVMQGQTVNLEAFAYDADEGTMPDDMLSWTSNLNGALGDGRQVSVAELSVGTHTITFEADDSQGGVMSDQVQVTVVDDPAKLPAPANRLVAGPRPVTLVPGTALGSEVVHVNNEGRGSVGVQATVDQPWVKLSQASGATPMTVTLSFTDTGLTSGYYTATLTLTSPDAPQGGTTVPVRLAYGGYQHFLPVVLRGK